MAKVAFQDGFCLACHQVLARHLELDLSYLSALDFPDGPQEVWSKPNFLNLPPAKPVPPTEPNDDDDDDETSDVPAQP